MHKPDPLNALLHPTGYFIHDSLDIIFNHQSRSSWEYLVHHTMVSTTPAKRGASMGGLPRTPGLSPCRFRVLRRGKPEPFPPPRPGRQVGCVSTRQGCPAGQDACQHRLRAPGARQAAAPGEGRAGGWSQLPSAGRCNWSPGELALQTGFLLAQVPGGGLLGSLDGGGAPLCMPKPWWGRTCLPQGEES